VESFGNRICCWCPLDPSKIIRKEKWKMFFNNNEKTFSKNFEGCSRMGRRFVVAKVDFPMTFLMKILARTRQQSPAAATS
jgi:hypothetical protein